MLTRLTIPARGNSLRKWQINEGNTSLNVGRSTARVWLDRDVTE